MIKKIIFSLRFLLASLLMVFSSAYAETITFYPKNSGPSLLVTLRSIPGVQEVSPLLAETELQFLESQGVLRFHGALRINLMDGADAADVAHRLGEWGTAELNAVVIPQEHPEQWGLTNRGIPLELALTDIDTLMIRSRAGEDVGIRRVPPIDPSLLRKVRVAVVDSGVDLTHPSLQSKLRHQPQECEALEAYRACMTRERDKNVCHTQYARMDTDGNGYPLDCQGWSVLGAVDARTGIAGKNDPSDEVGHGTHVAGIIAAQGPVSGVVSDAIELIPVKVIGSDRQTSVQDAVASETLPSPQDEAFKTIQGEADVFARGVLYAIRTGAEVINLSLGYNAKDDSTLMREMIALALRRGILVVAAAGNQSSRSPVFPCLYPGVICVASHSADGSVSHFSNFGDAVDIAAPGHWILSTWFRKTFPSHFTERKGWDFLSGTSMAAPFVTGGLALLLQRGIPPDEAKARIFSGARPSQLPTAINDLSPKSTLFGNLDLGRAFEAVPRPWIVANQKSPLIAVWKGAWKSSSVSFTSSVRLPLKNLWADSSGAVEIRFLNLRSRDGRDASVQWSSQSFVFPSWVSGEEKVVEADLSIQDQAPLNGEWILDGEIFIAGQSMGRFQKSLEIVVPISPSRVETGSGVQQSSLHLPARLSSETTSLSFKPIRCRTGDTTGAPERLLAYGYAQGVLEFSILDLTDPSIQSESVSAFAAVTERLVNVDCLDVDQDGDLETVIESVDSASKIFSFRYFDSHSVEIPLWKSTLSTDITVPPREFSWFPVNGRYVPHWISRGQMPTWAQPPFDPWRDLAEGGRRLEDIRFYRALQGDQARAVSETLRVISPPPAARREPTLAYVRLLPESEEVLAYRGSRYSGSYSLVPLVNGEPSWRAERRLVFRDGYQHLALLKSFTVLGGGIGFWEESTQGRLRFFEVQSVGQVQSEVLSSWRLGDPARELIAVHRFGEEGVESFFRSRYSLFYQNSATDLKAFADPRMHEARTAHVLAKTQRGTLGLLLLEETGSPISTELVIPLASRELLQSFEMSRPARLKTLGVEGCRCVDAVASGVQSPVTKIRYLCGSSLIEIPLSIE